MSSKGLVQREPAYLRRRLWSMQAGTSDENTRQVPFEDPRAEEMGDNT